MLSILIYWTLLSVPQIVGLQNVTETLFVNTSLDVERM
jgi:hypothetical protein